MKVINPLGIEVLITIKLPFLELFETTTGPYIYKIKLNESYL